jgi:hypothetical protein
MTRGGQRLIVVAAILILILFFVILKFSFFTGGVKVMSVHDRVTEVVQSWARMPSLPDDKQELEVIWATSGPHFEFFPYGAQDLTTKLRTEFRDSKNTVLQFTDIYASTNTSGKIKTVEDLATAVRQNYKPQ